MSKRSNRLLVAGLPRSPLAGDIKDFRNLLIHEYFGVDLEIVWNTIHSELPILMATVREIEKEIE